MAPSIHPMFVVTAELERVCVHHPEATAELVCTRCGRWLCDGCARPLTKRRSGPKACPDCEGIVKVGERPKTVDTSEQLLFRMFGTEGAVSVILLALPGVLIGLGGSFALLFWLIYGGVLGGYYFQTIDHIARGRPGLPFSSDVMSWGGMVGKLLRGFSVLLVGVGPAAIARYYLPDAVPLQIGLLVVGATLMPASVLAGVVSNAAINQIWPPAWWEVVERAPRSYARLLLSIYGSAALWLAFVVVLNFALAPVYSLALLLTPIVNAFFVVWQAALFGRFLQREAESYGLIY